MGVTFVRLLCAASLLTVSSPSFAEQISPGRRGYLDVDSSQAQIVPAGGASSKIIFLNRCKNGCTLSPGYNDSRSNHTALIHSTIHVSPFEFGDDEWQRVVGCVQDMYEPFNVTITDQDPGNVPHFEAIVAGTGQEMQLGENVIGLAPTSCWGIIDNAITFTAANDHSSAIQICETIGQETAHTFSLDHEYVCESVMTYRNDCSVHKTFLDLDNPCGEDKVRQCKCGNNKQNSHEAIMDIFGAGPGMPPKVTIKRPKADEEVPPYFVIETTAEDNFELDHIEVYLNDTQIISTSQKPFIFNAPPDFPAGEVTVRVDAYDNRGNKGSKKVTVRQSEPCSENSCGENLMCSKGQCIAAPVDKLGLGAVCESNVICESGMCGNDGTNRYCTMPCAEGCPDGYACTGGEGGVCWPQNGGAAVAEKESGGCQTSSGTWVSLIVLLTFGAWTWGRNKIRKQSRLQNGVTSKPNFS